MVLTYLAWVAPFVAEDYLEDKSSAKSPAKMNETRTAVNNEIVAYLKVTVAQLEKKVQRISRKRKCHTILPSAAGNSKHAEESDL